MYSVNLVVVKPGCLSEVEHLLKGTTNTSVEQEKFKPQNFVHETFSLELNFVLFSFSLFLSRCGSFNELLLFLNKTLSC